MEAVPPGTMVLGHELHRSLKLKKGDKVPLMDKTFTVHQLQPEKGNNDDITIWINLAEAQRLLGKEGRINAILALECGCEADRLSVIRADVAKILPDTQVIEFASQAIARAEARNRAEAESKAALLQEEEQRNQLRRPGVVRLDPAAAGDRHGGAVGRLPDAGQCKGAPRRDRHPAGHRPGLPANPAAVPGQGADGGAGRRALGYLAGVAVASFVHGQLEPIDARWLTIVLLAAPAIAGLASWIPALLATQQDPALVLREG